MMCRVLESAKKCAKLCPFGSERVILTFQTSIKLLPAIHRMKKICFSSRKQCVKMEKRIDLFTMLAIDTKSSPFLPKAVCKFTNLYSSSRKGWSKRMYKVY